MLSWVNTGEPLQDYDSIVCHAPRSYVISFQDSCAPKVILPNQDVRKLHTKFQTNSNNLSLKFGPWNFSDWRSGSHMAGCNPSECDGICWCSLIFLSSQANSSPKPYCQLSTRHTFPSPSPLLGWGACGDKWEHFQNGREPSLLFPFFNPLCRCSPSPMSFAFEIWNQVGANCPRTGSSCNAIVLLMSASLKLKIIVWVYFSVWRHCCDLLAEGAVLLHQHRGTAQTQQLLKTPQTSGGTAANSASIPIHRVYLLCLPESWCFSAQRTQGSSVWICSRCSHVSWMLLLLKLAWDNQPTPNETISLLVYIKSQTSFKLYNLHPVSRLMKLGTTSLTIVCLES